MEALAAAGLQGSIFVQPSPSECAEVEPANIRVSAWFGLASNAAMRGALRLTPIPDGITELSASGEVLENMLEVALRDTGYASVAHLKLLPPIDSKSLMADGTAPKNRHQEATSKGGRASFKAQFKSELSEKRRLEIGVLVSARHTHCCPELITFFFVVEQPGKEEVQRFKD